MKSGKTYAGVIRRFISLLIISFFVIKKEEFKMKGIFVSSVEGYSGKSAVIIATMEKIDEILGKAGIRGDAKIRRIKEHVERAVDLGRLLEK